jgi:signal transduction histidine kinase
MNSKTPVTKGKGKTVLPSDDKALSLPDGYGRVREIMSNLGDSAWSHDFRTGTTWYSSQYNPFIGFIPADLKDDQTENIWWESTHPDDRHLLKESDLAYKSMKQDKHALEYRIFDDKGKMHWVLDRGVVVEKDADGKPVLLVGTHVDITTTKELQAKIASLLEKQNKVILKAVIERIEMDRKEIANVLHENVNQILTAGRMMLEFLPVMDKAVGEFTEKVKQIMYSAVDEVNKICNDINPDSLAHISLTDLVTDLVNRLTKGKTISISFDHSGFSPSKKKNKDHELTILRAIQECLHIIVHESAAQSATIHLESNNDFMLLEVFCDDKKLKVNSLSSALRMKNMVNRCELFGGSFHLEKKGSEGMLFKASIPV